jgi:hypothetical protein
MTQGHRTREMGQLSGELQMLLCFGSKAIVKYVVMRRPIFDNECCRSNLLTVSGDRYPQCRK